MHFNFNILIYIYKSTNLIIKSCNSEAQELLGTLTARPGGPTLPGSPGKPLGP